MSCDDTSKPPRIALVSIGIGRVQRGYERYFSDLFNVLREHLPMTLYKGCGECSENECIPPLLGSATLMARRLPLRTLPDGAVYRKYEHDCLAYGLAMLPALMQSRFDLVHMIDYPLAKVLERFRRIFRFRARLLYCNGCCAPPEHYPRADHVHHIAQPMYEDALAQGVDPAHLTLAPCGVHTKRFHSNLDRQQLREKHGIAEDTFVVLVVSAVKRMHKRVDHIVEEVSKVVESGGRDLLLWIDGSVEDPTLVDLARQKLGSQCRITHVVSDDVAELYGLADVMVHAALEEAFGLAIIEAISTGLPVLAHDAMHFRWLVGEEDCLVDMSVRGPLANRLREMLRERDNCRAQSETRASRAIRRFDWSQLVPEYVAMYHRVASGETETTTAERGAA